jgi:hypothetical protein
MKKTRGHDIGNSMHLVARPVLQFPRNRRQYHAHGQAHHRHRLQGAGAPVRRCHRQCRAAAAMVSQLVPEAAGRHPLGHHYRLAKLKICSLIYMRPRLTSNMHKMLKITNTEQTITKPIQPTLNKYCQINIGCFIIPIRP